MNSLPTYSGIVLVDKPVGPTSFSVVSRIRRIFGVKKVGHCGTLDPFASGLLPICIGKATRVIRYMDSYDKEYRCTAKFGAFTDTQDKEGTVVGGREPSPEEREEIARTDGKKIRELIQALQGDSLQMPPMYSAVKIGGKPLYSYARDGIEIDRSPRRIHIASVEVHSVDVSDSLTADFSVSCSKGTYIRTLCDTLGQQSGFGCHARSLRRTRCGPFVIASAYSLEDLEKMCAEGCLADALLPESIALSHLFRLDVSEEEKENLCLGRQMPLEIFTGRIPEYPENSDTNSRICAYYDNEPVAVVFPDDKEGRKILRIERVLA